MCPCLLGFCSDLLYPFSFIAISLFSITAAFHLVKRNRYLEISLVFQLGFLLHLSQNILYPERYQLSPPGSQTHLIRRLTLSWVLLHGVLFCSSQLLSLATSATLILKEGKELGNPLPTWYPSDLSLSAWQDRAAFLQLWSGLIAAKWDLFKASSATRLTDITQQRRTRREKWNGFSACNSKS